MSSHAAPADLRPGWRGFCSNEDCACYLPDPRVCDEHKHHRRYGGARCYECGWPREVHDLRDVMARAGLRLIISAERADHSEATTE